jgi:hypothetical protein
MIGTRFGLKRRHFAARVMRVQEIWRGLKARQVEIPFLSDEFLSLGPQSDSRGRQQPVPISGCRGWSCRVTAAFLGGKSPRGTAR